MNRLAIGGNQPPALDAMALHIEDLFALVSGSTASAITTDEQEAALDELLDQVRQASTDATAKCEEEYRPHKVAADGVKTAWKPLFDRCTAATNAIKERMTPYRTARQKAKDDAARIIREEAAAKQEAAQAALRKSDDLEERFAAEEQLAAAAKLTAQANKIDRAPSGLRTHWEAEVTDRRAALNHYIAEQPEMFVSLIQELADKDARQPATRRAIPGIAFHERKRAA